MEKDPNYSEILLSSLNNLRNSNLVCDFTVKVNNELFFVHRAVLAAASKYFAAMFSSDMKEIREGFVDIKELDVAGVKQCIEYMYTGGIKPDNKTVQHTLKASHLIQLDGLNSICFKFLKKSISVETCLSTLNLSSLYGRDELHDFAEDYFLEHFESVTLTEMFPLISKSDLLHYIEASKATYEVTWQALVRWFSVEREERSEILLDVMKSTKVTGFPFKFLLDTVLKEPLVKQNKSCQSFVTACLLHDVETLKINLTTENFFVIKNLAATDDIPNEKKSLKVLEEYLQNNFEELSKNEKFCNLKENEVISLFRSSKTKYSSEKIKWDSALVWVKHDGPHRKKVFLKLFKLLKLDLFSGEFLQETVLTEILVNDSPKCKDLLLSVLVAEKRADDKVEEALVPHIACFNFKRGDIKALNLRNGQWKDLPSLNFTQFDKYNRLRKLVNVDNKLFCVDDINLHQFDQIQMIWVKKQSFETKPTKFSNILSTKEQLYVVDCNFMACYSVTDNVWNEDLPGCELIGHFCAASSDEFIYAMGGYKNGTCIADAKRFQIESESWSEIAPLNDRRNYASAAVFHDMIFVVGGVNGGKCLDSVEIFDPLVKTWTYVRNMCTGRMCPTACVTNNRLYVVGGAVKNGKILDIDSIEVYDEEKREWEIVAELNSTHGYISCSTINLLRR